MKNNSSYTSITSKASSVPAVGTIVCKYGMKNGFGTAKIVKRSCTVTDTGSDISILKLVSVSPYKYNTVKEGDSGGSVYIGHELHGSVSMVNSTNWFYSPIGGVTSSFKLKTS